MKLTNTFFHFPIIKKKKKSSAECYSQSSSQKGIPFVEILLHDSEIVIFLARKKIQMT